MKKKVLVFALCFCLCIVSAFALFACTDRTPEKSVIGDIKQDDITMTVSATANSIVINIDSDETAGNAKTDIIEASAYEYVSGDKLFGLSTSKVNTDDASKKVGTYKLSTSATVTLDRYIESDGGDVDRLYNKYYVVSGKNILKGPIYATEIVAQNNAEPELDIKSKKGLLGENVKYYEDLGCSYATLNFDIEDLVYPNEMFDDDGAIELAHPDDAIEFVSNGKKYYFNRERVAEYDRSVKAYYALGSHITAIVYARNNGANPEVFPSKMTYLPWSTTAVEGKAAPVLLGLNTSNEYGYNYFVAVMEFLASRYTADDLSNGYVANYILGNEINFPYEYNRISKYHASLDVYMEEYSRLLRLANLAVKKFDGGVTVNVSFTQSWAKKYEQSNTVHAYTPKAMIEWLNTKTKLEGDYDWGIAPHCYTYGLALPYVFLNDTTNGVNVGMNGDEETSAYLTISNLEILDSYLNRPEMTYDGKARSVWLTEYGVSTYLDGEKERNVQAGAIAASWYKISQLDTVKSFSYYRLFDHSAEIGGGARFGLIDVDGEKKPSYELYKYIDTQYSQVVAKDYLRYLEYQDPAGKLQTVNNGGIKSYMDLLDVFGTEWVKTEFEWEYATPVTAATVYEWDDLIDLTGVKFESANYLYDGTQKSIEVENVPEGVEVSYSVSPVLTEVGSKEIIATFKKNGEFVGHRKATLSVGQLSTDKTVYNYGESIFVTADVTKPDLARTAWIGIYDKGAIPGNVSAGDVSYYYYYPNQFGDTCLRTVRLQDYPNPDVKDVSLGAGEYVIYYFVDGGYNYFYGAQIKVLGKTASTGDVDLGDVEFADKTVTYDGGEKLLEISGDLPDGVTVEYINNALTELGSVQAVAVFKRGEEELCRRYAVLTVTRGDVELISTNKTSYFEGEDVLVTAYAPASSEPNTWWVGLYLATDEDYPTVGSIYFYYVKDDNHVSGAAYGIKKQIANANRDEYAHLPVGSYKLVLFNTSGYTVETECAFEVVELSVEGVEASISVDSSTVALGAPVLVSASVADSDFKLVVALMKSSADGVIENAIYSYELEAGESEIDVTEGTLNAELSYYVPLRAGSYKLALFVVNGEAGGAKLKQEVAIQLGTDEQQPSAGVIYANKTSYDVGEEVFVTAYAPDGNTSWWVGLYPKSQESLSAPPSIRWYSVNDATHVSGEAYSIMKQLYTNYMYGTLPAGEYKVVLFNTGSYDVESVFEFEVVGGGESGDDDGITTNKTVYAVGETIYVTAYAPEGDTSWWVGLYLADETDYANSASIYWYYVNGDKATSGEPFDISSGDRGGHFEYESLPAGEYKVVLFNTPGYTEEAHVMITITDAE